MGVSVLTFHVSLFLKRILSIAFFLLSLSTLLRIVNAQQYVDNNIGSMVLSDYDFAETPSVRVQRALEILRYYYEQEEVTYEEIIIQRNHAIELLRSASHDNNTDAMLYLANIEFFGLFEIIPEIEDSVKYYDMLQKANGSAFANNMMGFFYSTSFSEYASNNPALARIHWELAAKQGSLDAHQFLAYHNLIALNMPQSDEEAVKHYKFISDHLFEEECGSNVTYLNCIWPEIQDYNFAGENGMGVYGAASAYTYSDAYQALHTRSQYLREMSNSIEDWDYELMFEVAKLRLHGMYKYPRNYTVSDVLFRKVSRQYWPYTSENSVLANTPQSIISLAAQSCGYLGLLHLFDKGPLFDIDKAYWWFKRGATKNDSNSYYGLGYMAYHGLTSNGVDREKGMRLINLAVMNENPHALMFLGLIRLEEARYEEAYHLFLRAATQKSVISYKYLADCYYNGTGTSRSMISASLYYKKFVEAIRASATSMAIALEEIDEYGYFHNSFVYYLYAAQMGYALAEINAAYLMDENKFLINSVFRYFNYTQSEQEAAHDKFAYEFYSRAAAQGDIDAIFKLGDYYYYGIGTPKDYSKAYTCYKIAYEQSSIGMGLWNMAYMHEYGIGRDQDIYIARRLLDELSSNQNSYFPLKVAIFWINIHQLYIKLLKLLRLR